MLFRGAFFQLEITAADDQEGVTLSLQKLRRVHDRTEEWHLAFQSWYFPLGVDSLVDMIFWIGEHIPSGYDDRKLLWQKAYEQITFATVFSQEATVAQDLLNHARIRHLLFFSR